MSVKSIQLATADSKRGYEQKNKRRSNVSFGSMGNPVITLMDAIDRGGFAASFIMQDFLGMAGPRFLAGIYRNHDKTGKLNWDFAKKEGTREVLSGPSAFIIPAIIISFVKRISGTANNVPVDFIKGLSETFKDYAKTNVSELSNVAAAKNGFYESVFKNLLSTSTNNSLKSEELDEAARVFAEKLISAEKAPKKGFWKHVTGKHVAGSAQELHHDLLKDFVDIRKKYNGVNSDKVVAEYTGQNGKKIATSFKSIVSYMNDYANDAIKNVNKKFKGVKNIQPQDVENFIVTLGKRRSGSRFLTNMSMWLAVVGFYTIIPKLYNNVTKGRDPGLDGLDVQEQNSNKTSNPTFSKDNKKHKAEKADNSVKVEPSFTGIGNFMAKVGDTVTDKKFIKGLSDGFEFDGATMSMPAMLSLLFGFCLPPRLLHAQSNTDRKEILFRDITSFLSILFGAKLLTRIFSDVFAKTSGLALNIKPHNNEDSVFKKIWHYVYPSGGVQVLDDARIKANYSNVASYKDGINDMFRFIDSNGGNVGKMLNIDKDIKAASEKILGKAPDGNMKLDDIIKAFDKAKDTDSYKSIVRKLADESNTIVRRAKTYNSLFGFASTIFLVPALMIWISRHCEKMTKQHIAEQKKQSMTDMAKQTQIPDSMQVVTNKPTMAGFLNKV